MLEHLHNPDWFMQEKKDGVRQIVECRAATVTAGNRNGLTVAVSAAIAEGGNALKHKFKPSATCAVLSHNPAKRSVLVPVLDDSAPASVTVALRRDWQRHHSRRSPDIASGQLRRSRNTCMPSPVERFFNPSGKAHARIGTLLTPMAR